MVQSVSYLWREPKATDGFTAGVSLHSHTNQSKETLDFIAELSTDWGVLQPIMRWAERRCQRTTGIRPDYARSYWTPPLTPRLAFDLERQQIEEKLQLPAMVSLTDHDDIQAPMLLRSLASARQIPVSLEWTVPYGATSFHLGIHNLPSASGAEWMRRMEAFTVIPVAQRPAKLLTEMLAELDELPGVLIVFNHPLWDLYRIGEERHRVLVNDFLAVHGQFCHAVELNGLRHWDENREVAQLAAQWNQLLISGGDRHGVEPNANLNLTRAANFTEFVHEVRNERQSHVLFMPQYAEPWKQRILNSTLAAIRNYPDFPEGSRCWDDRVYHPDANGNMRVLSQLWLAGSAPVYLSAVLAFVRLLGAVPVSSGLRLAWNDASAMRSVMAEREA
ncbi:MAG: PHP domain-containing protein [Acidobacteriaceae bacterium]